MEHGQINLAPTNLRNYLIDIVLQPVLRLAIRHIPTSRQVARVRAAVKDIYILITDGLCGGPMDFVRLAYH